MTDNTNCRICGKDPKKHDNNQLFECYLKLPEHQPTENNPK